MNAARVAGVSAYERSPRGALVAIGNFDGVHRGHQAVIGAVAARARARGLEPVVLTFDPHPSAVLGRGLRAVLTGIDRKVELVARIDSALRVVVEPFTHELAALSPRAFVEALLVAGLGACEVNVGENFRFGKARAGSFDTLRELGAELGFEARAEALAGDATGTYSSSRARDALAAGDLAELMRLLGRPHSVRGRVARGQGRGRTIGVPTANLEALREAPPAFGVYAVVVDVLDASGEVRALARGVANVGVRPTLAAGFSFEVHLYDWSDDLYGAELRVHLVERLREERRFAGFEELVAQIRSDVARGDELTRAVERATGAAGWF